MQRASRALAALVVISATAGCYHYTADIPGVLDTRSDGSTADASPIAVDDEELARQGFDALIAGDGVRVNDAQVTVEERHFFAGVTLLFPGVFVLSNESSNEEMKAALGDAALRELRVGHRSSGFDLLLTVLPALVPCVPLLLAPHPYTFSASGERIAAGGRPPENRSVPPPVDVKEPPAEAPPVDAEQPLPEAPPADVKEPLPNTKDSAAKDDAAKDSDVKDSDVKDSERGGAP